MVSKCNAENGCMNRMWQHGLRMWFRKCTISRCLYHCNYARTACIHMMCNSSFNDDPFHTKNLWKRCFTSGRIVIESFKSILRCHIKNLENDLFYIPLVLSLEAFWQLIYLLWDLLFSLDNVLHCKSTLNYFRNGCHLLKW